MKLKFKKQQFQSDAVAAVVDLFKGQASSVSTFTVNKLDLVDKNFLCGYNSTDRGRTVLAPGKDDCDAAG